ncbi:uncharacterized protein [Euwallacea similis]|uniref:uncharacterized protein n=1 Tax=Euwallacea similis TaxID=1736056 RepID=UPI00344E532B
MGRFPDNRLIGGSVFSVVGMDYMGPLNIRDKRGRDSRLSKCYVSVFIYFTMKTLHLELVSDFSSQSFLLAFRRFVARHERSNHIYSDNGTNFVSANRELSELGNFLIKESYNLVDSCVREEVFGRLVSTQIEVVLNSRPLSSMSQDPNDLTPLLPAHFLIRKSLTELPYPGIQLIKQHFWKQWNKEYIGELHQSVKWKMQQQDVQEEVLVLVKEDNLLPSKWRLGRIVTVHPGRDGVNRLAHKNFKCILNKEKKSLVENPKIKTQPSQERIRLNINSLPRRKLIYSYFHPLSYPHVYRYLFRGFHLGARQPYPSGHIERLFMNGKYATCQKKLSKMDYCLDL